MIKFCLIKTLEQLQKAPDVKVEAFTIDNTPENPYFGDWSAEISESGDRVSILFPIKEELPENIMVMLS